MFLLSGDPAYASFTVRPVNKATDRPIVREIFRQEFYGDDCPIYPHESLWEIYDGMDTSGVFGAYLVCRGEQILFLLEIHPAVQMDLSAEHSADPGSIVIYCFFYSRDETIYLPAFRACIASLLDYPGINRILTSGAAGNDTTGVFLEKTGFSRLPDPAGTLPADGRTRDNWSLEKLLSGGILFASPPSFTE